MFTRKTQRYESLLSCTAELTIHNFSWVQSSSVSQYNSSQPRSNMGSASGLCLCLVWKFKPRALPSHHFAAWGLQLCAISLAHQSPVLCTFWWAAQSHGPAWNLRQLGQDDQQREVPGGEDCHPGNLIEFEPCGPGHLGSSALCNVPVTPFTLTVHGGPHNPMIHTPRLDAFLFTWEVC